MDKKQQVLQLPLTRSGYSIPLSDKPVIMQGYNGPYSHFAMELFYPTRGISRVQDDRFSLDFIVDPGTPVLAARSGIVKFFCNDCSGYYTGEDPGIGMVSIPNFVLISHDDGSHTIYSHLAKGSVCVMANESVCIGQELAKTGLSGWIGDVPHLHFSALELTSAYNRRSFPVNFADYTGPLEHAILFPGVQIDKQSYHSIFLANRPAGL